MIQRSTMALLVLATLGATFALADTEQMIDRTAKKTDGALAVLSCKFTTELGSQPIIGQALCIKPTGLFMTLVFNPAMKPEELSDLQLTLPGLGGKSAKAKLVGIDPETGMGFVQAESSDVKWTALEFAEKPNLFVGTPVASVGIMPADTGHSRYFGVAYVSTMVRIPEKQIYVSGGTLTSPGSPVLTGDGKVVGLVHRQRQLSQQYIATDRGAVPVRTTGQFETSFFMPIDELQYILANAGKARKLPWIGVVRFKPLGEDVATVMKLTNPGVMIDKIVPDTPAANAKLQSRDVIISLNGYAIEELGTPAYTAQNLERQLLRMPVGADVKLSIFRDGKVFDVTLKTAAMPTRVFEAERYYSSPMGLGVRQRVALDDYLDDSPVAKVPGVIVYMVRQDSPAHASQVKENDVVVGLAGTPVSSLDSFKRAEQRVMGDPSLKEIQIEVMRGDRKESLRIRPSR